MVYAGIDRIRKESLAETLVLKLRNNLLYKDRWQFVYQLASSQRFI